jgi:hypothetical protein
MLLFEYKASTSAATNVLCPYRPVQRPCPGHMTSISVPVDHVSLILGSAKSPARSLPLPTIKAPDTNDEL